MEIAERESARWLSVGRVFFTLPSTYSTKALVLHCRQICIRRYHIWI